MRSIVSNYNHVLEIIFACMRDLLIYLKLVHIYDPFMMRQKHEVTEKLDYAWMLKQRGD